MILPNRDQLLYHVTEKKNLTDIKTNGLVPKIGPRSQNAGETEPKTYLFRHREDMENAVVNWLGDEFDEDESIVALEIQMPATAAKNLAFDIQTPYEVTYDSIIPPNWIKDITDL